MSESVESKTLLACLDKFVIALRADPVTVSIELAAAGVIPPPSGQIEAQQLAQRILDIVRVEPARYYDVVKALSKHVWLKDIVKILNTTCNHTKEQRTTEEVPGLVDKHKSGQEEPDAKDHEATPPTPSKDESDQLEYDYPHKPSSLPVPNPVVLFEELSEDDREDLFSQMSEMTKDMNLRFKKLFNQVYESFRKHVEHSSVILTLTKDDVMIFDQDDKLDEAKDMFEVFKAIRPHCSYFNYDLLELLVEVHGSAKDKEKMTEYLQSFSSYCKAMPCAEEVCGNGDSGSKRIKLKFKINVDRQQLKPDALRRIKCNIARHIKIQPRSLYLCRVEEGCVLLEFLIPAFLFGRVFPLNDEQKVALYNEEKVLTIQCDDPSFHVVVGESKTDTLPPPIAKVLEKPNVTLTVEQLNRLKQSILLDKLCYLCEELGDPDRYFPELRSKGILSTTDTQLINSRLTDQEKTEEFVTLISTRQNSHGQHGLDVFVEALKKQRVQAYITRTLLRALNRKKAEAERKNVDYGYHPEHRPIPPYHGPPPTCSRRGQEYHPELLQGALPPSPPPTSIQEDNIPGEPDGSVHPIHGLLPPSPPPLSTNQNEKKEAFHPPPYRLANTDNIAKLNVLQKEKSDTFSTIMDNMAADLDTLRKAFERLKHEKKQLEVEYGEAVQEIYVLKRENARLRKQVQQRPLLESDPSYYSRGSIYGSESQV